MIRLCDDNDFDIISSIINEAAEAYRGVIPADRWHEPYMPREELRHEIDSGFGAGRKTAKSWALWTSRMCRT